MTKLRPTDGAVLGTFAVGPGPSGVGTDPNVMAVDENALWVGTVSATP